jgi:hypothetical protein
MVRWLKPAERRELKDFLTGNPQIERLDRYRFRINDRQVDFSSLITLPCPKKVPIKLAFILGLYVMVVHEVFPAMLESLKSRQRK